MGSFAKDKVMCIALCAAVGFVLVALSPFAYLLLVPQYREPFVLRIMPESVLARAEFWPARMVRPGTFTFNVPFERFEQEARRRSDARPIVSYELVQEKLFLQLWLPRGDGTFFYTEKKDSQAFAIRMPFLHKTASVHVVDGMFVFTMGWNWANAIFATLLSAFFAFVCFAIARVRAKILRL